MSLIQTKVQSWSWSAQSPDIRCGPSQETSSVVLEKLMQSRFSKFGNEIAEAIETCRDWKPAYGVPHMLRQAVHIIVQKIEEGPYPASRRRASTFRQVKRESNEDEVHKPTAPPPQTLDHSNELASLFRNLFFVRFCDALHSLSDGYSEQVASCKSDMGMETCSTESISSRCRMQNKDACSISDCSTDEGEADSVSSSCSSASQLVYTDDGRDEELPVVFEFVDLLLWICRCKRLPTNLKECFCNSQLIGDLARICKHAPEADACGVLTVIRTLQTVVTCHTSSEAMCTMRVQSLITSDWVSIIADQFQPWICRLLTCRNGMQLVGQLLGGIGDITRDLLQHQDACVAVQGSKLAFRIHAVIEEFLLADPLVWPRAVMLFADTVQAAPDVDSVQIGMELCSRLRGKFCAMSSHDVGNIVSMLSMRMNSLRRKLQTEGGGLPVRRPLHSSTRKSFQGDRANLFLPSIPQRRASSCRGFRSTCRQHGTPTPLPGLKTI